MARGDAAPRAIISTAVSDVDAPRVLRLAESSTPLTPPQPILTLSSDDISHFFVRLRRDPDSERWEVRLDAALREILERANDFVPSESGGILLDDPRAKLAGSPAPRLTTIKPEPTLDAGRVSPGERAAAGRVLLLIQRNAAAAFSFYSGIAPRRNPTRSFIERKVMKSDTAVLERPVGHRRRTATEISSVP